MISTRQSFEQQIRLLEQNVVRLGAVVEGMLADAMRSLLEQDVALAGAVVRQDDVADDLDLEIEHQCVRLLALQQPLSKDLRTITTIIKIIADLERVGDYSVDIAKTGERIAGQPFFQPMVDLPLMGEKTLQIVHDTIRAFVDRDLDLARRICTEEDDVVDDLHDRLFEELIQRMQESPESVPQAARFLLISRYLERIADHCTNVAERISYMETGHLEELKVKEEEKNGGAAQTHNGSPL
jgi:phosphate transport system protein